MHTRTTRRQFRLKRQTFSIWRPCWRPYWISRLAIIYANLCRQFQKLQTIGNILIYDTSCCTGGVRVTPRKSGQFHSLSPYQGETSAKVFEIQSTLVISNSKGLSEILRYIRTSTYQICRIEEKLIRLTTFNKQICNWTLEVRDILKILWKRGAISLFHNIFYMLLDFHI